MFGTALSYLALLLLTQPNINERALPYLNSRMVLSAVQKQAIALELMDRREAICIFARPDDFVTDVKLIRQRHVELADAPFVVDSFFWPERDHINGYIGFNIEHRKWVEGQIAFNPSCLDLLIEDLNQTNRLYHIWDTVRDSRCEYYFVNVRRRALKHLRDDLLGPDAYYRHQLPSIIP